MVAIANVDYTPLGLTTSKRVDGRYFTIYIRAKIAGRYIQGRYVVLKKVRYGVSGR